MSSTTTLDRLGQLANSTLIDGQSYSGRLFMTHDTPASKCVPQCRYMCTYMHMKIRMYVYRFVRTYYIRTYYVRMCVLERYEVVVFKRTATRGALH